MTSISSSIACDDSRRHVQGAICNREDLPTWGGDAESHWRPRLVNDLEILHFPGVGGGGGYGETGSASFREDHPCGQCKLGEARERGIVTHRPITCIPSETVGIVRKSSSPTMCPNANERGSLLKGKGIATEATCRGEVGPIQHIHLGRDRDHEQLEIINSKGVFGSEGRGIMCGGQ